jgi:hypothetical protein
MTERMHRSSGLRAGGAIALLAGAAVFGTTTAAGAVSGGAPADPDSYRFLVKLEVAQTRSCSGVLVDPRWIMTARSCFADGTNPVQAGPPPAGTTAIVGRPDLTATSGHVLPVVHLVPHPSRDLVLARLAEPVRDIAPVPIATVAPAVGDVVQIAGYGRTATGWVPDTAHTAPFPVDAVTGTSLEVGGRGADGPSLCKGDAGGPALRRSGTGWEAVAVTSASWQGGCLGSTETRRGAVEVRVDDISAWIRANTPVVCEEPGTSTVSDQQPGVSQLVDPTGDCRFDIMGQYADGALRAFASTGNLSGSHTLFAGPSNVVGAGWGSANVQRIITGDFTGDGKADIGAQYVNGELRVFSSTGDLSGRNTLFAGPSNVAGAGWGSGNVERIITGDFTGDGKVDIGAQYVNGELRVFSSTGDLSGKYTLFAGPSNVAGAGWGSGNVQRIITGDFTGDGKVDIGAQYVNGELRVFSSTGDLSGKNTLFAGPSNVAGSGWTAANVQRIL